jgi:gamma-glutamyl-gamma-aminobutyrate hydrolase PuuD
MTYRVGRKLGRTIYHQAGEEPSDHDELVGVMDTPILAAMFVYAINHHQAIKIAAANALRVLAQAEDGEEVT